MVIYIIITCYVECSYDAWVKWAVLVCGNKIRLCVESNEYQMRKWIGIYPFECHSSWVYINMVYYMQERRKWRNVKNRQAFCNQAVHIDRASIHWKIDSLCLAYHIELFNFYVLLECIHFNMRLSKIVCPPLRYNAWNFFIVYVNACKASFCLSHSFSLSLSRSLVPLALRSTISFRMASYSSHMTFSRSPCCRIPWFFFAQVVFDVYLVLWYRANVKQLQTPNKNTNAIL